MSTDLNDGETSPQGGTDRRNVVESLGSNAADYGPLAFRALVGLLPGGSLIAGMVEAIPGQRIDRVVTCLKLVASDVADLEATLEELLKSPLRLRLLEAGVSAAQRASSEERIRRLARLISEGLIGGEKVALRKTRLLLSLDELDDEEVWVLTQIAKVRSVGITLQDTSVQDSTNLTHGTPDFPGVPLQLSEIPEGDLYLILSRLSSAGLAEAGTAVILVEGETPKKVFSVSPAGRALLEETTVS